MTYWQEKIKIGSLHIPRFIGGPLDGITDSPFRQLVREFSTDELLFTEMRHVACVANDKTGRLSLNFIPSERPLAYQISASQDQWLEQACEKILACGVDSIDLNIGCPANNVVKSGAGCALMADLPRLKTVVQKLRTIIKIPLTVKMRAGFKEKNAVHVAQLLQDCGVDAITIHPRLRNQMFAGRPDYALVAQVKQLIQIPVLLSGNVVNWQTAQLAHQQTGVDGFLIGRGMWSKPWKLKELSLHAQGTDFSTSTSTVIAYALKHIDLMLQHYGKRGLYCFRKHIPFYIKGLVGASQLRQELVSIECPDKMRETLLNLSRI